MIIVVIANPGGVEIQKARERSGSSHVEMKVDSIPRGSIHTYENMEAQLQVLNKAVRDQEDKVEERRKVLTSIIGTKTLLHKSPGLLNGSSKVDQEQGIKTALENYNAVEQEKMQLESQITSLLKFDSDRLIGYAAGLDLPDNVIKILYPQYLECKLQLDFLKTRGVGDRDPTVLAAKENIRGLKSQLDEEVVNLRATLQAQLSTAEERLKSVGVRRQDTPQEPLKLDLNAQDYADAKRDFESDLRLLHILRLKQIESKVANTTDGGPAD